MHRTAAWIALMACLAFGCAKNEKKAPADKAGRVSNVAHVSRVEPRSDQAPNFSWMDASGVSRDFDSYKGSVTLVNFWATWCGPCKKELPDLVALSQELAPRDVKIIGISTDKGGNVSSKIEEYVSTYGIPYQIVIANDELEEAFGNVNALPTSFIITRDGTISETLIGLRSKEDFRERLTSYLQ